MKTILILGGYGFLGTNILKYIDDNYLDQYRAIVFDKSVNHLAGLLFKCVSKCYAGDFMDGKLLETIFKENRIDMVIHALSTTVPSSSINSKYDITSNLLPTLDVLDFMVKYRVRDIVYISSGGAIYGNASHPHSESEDVFPVSSYGVVKVSIEKYLFQYSILFGLRPLVLRLSNPYGTYHYSMKHGICNVAIASALNKSVFNVYGDGLATKDYIFVDDFVAILFMLIRRNVHNEVLNIASGQMISINTILDKVKEFFPDFIWRYNSASPYDVQMFALNTSKLRQYIGDYVFTDFSDGIKATVSWSKSLNL